MTINFDEYKEGESITIISNGIAKTYINPRLIYKTEKPPIYPPLCQTEFKIIFNDSLVRTDIVKIDGDSCKVSKV